MIGPSFALYTSLPCGHNTFYSLVGYREWFWVSAKSLELVGDHHVTVLLLNSLEQMALFKLNNWSFTVSFWWLVIFILVRCWLHNLNQFEYLTLIALTLKCFKILMQNNFTRTTMRMLFWMCECVCVYRELYKGSNLQKYLYTCTFFNRSNWNLLRIVNLFSKCYYSNKLLHYAFECLIFFLSFYFCT